MNEKIEATVTFNSQNYDYQLIKDWFTSRNFEIEPLKFGYTVFGDYNLFREHFGPLTIDLSKFMIPLTINLSKSMIPLPILQELKECVESINMISWYE